MNESKYNTTELSIGQMKKTKGGHPLLLVLGAVATVVSVGRIIDTTGQWFLEGWNNPS